MGGRNRAGGEDLSFRKNLNRAFRQKLQACAFSNMSKRSSAAITRETLTLYKPSGATMTSASVRHGLQIAGLEVLNRTTLGTLKAAATCAGPLSFAMKTEALESTAFICAKLP